MRLLAWLDYGCWPGSITVDLAAIVAPAEVVGVDHDPAQLELAAIRAAEFVRIKPSASCDCWTTEPELTKFVANFLATYCISSEFAGPLTQLNLASADELQSSSEALRWWGEDADAFAAEPWGEAVAWRS